jgi:hypothetical protein
VAVVLLLDAVPSVAGLDRAGRGLFRAAAIGALSAFAVAIVGRSLEVWSFKTVRVAPGQPADSFWADSRGELVNRSVEELRGMVGRGDTLACLPEGTLINYLLRMRNPSPFFVVLPPEVLLFGRETIVDSYRRSAPDWILLHGRRLEEYGVEAIGRDFLPELGEHFAANYRPELLVGQDPRNGRGFGALVLARVGGGSSPSSPGSGRP